MKCNRVLRSLGRGEWAFILGVVWLLLPLGAMAAAAAPMTPAQKQAVLARTERLVKERAYAADVDFAAWPAHLARHAAAIDAAQDTQAFSRALNRALREFGISHLDVQMAAPEQARDTTMVGLGIVWNPGARGEGIRITAVKADSPAARLGLKPGDVILEADGQPLRESSQGDKAEALRGPEGSSLALKVRRAGGAVESMTAVRGRFRSQDPPTLVWAAPDAAVLRIPTFSAGYEPELVEQHMRAAAKAAYLVLDLGGNGGGDVANMNHLLGCFLPAGTKVGTNVNRALAERYEHATGLDPNDTVKVAAWATRKVAVRRNPVAPFAGKVAVLVNWSSASASEITAQALRELCGARIVGTHTAGAVLVSTYVTMDGGFQMKVPLSEYVSIGGRRMEGNPISPDHRSPPHDAEAGVKAALEALREAK